MPRPTLFDHPKFQRLVLLLKMPEPHVLGHLEYLWRVGYSCGEAVIGDVVDVEVAAKWTGAPGEFVSAMSDQRVRLLDTLPDGRYAIHDLMHHAPDYVLSRKKRERERLGEKRCENCGNDFRSTEAHAKYCCDACRVAAFRQREKRSVTKHYEPPSHSPSPSHSPIEQPASAGSPEPAEPAAGANATRPSGPSALGTSSRSSGSVAPATRAIGPVGCEFPVVGKGRPPDGFWRPTDEQLDEWGEAFPDLDVLAELRKARQWVLADPGRRKTFGGMARFVVGWLGRAQNSGSGRRDLTPARIDVRKIPKPEGVR